jgi:murein DD-endopeptidase MepM/ murein hydrolase activator NlpD
VEGTACAGTDTIFGTSPSKLVVLASPAVSRESKRRAPAGGRKSRSPGARSSSTAIRTGAVAVLLAAAAVPLVAGNAAGEETLKDLQARMNAIQAELDATTARIEELRDEKDRLTQRISDIEVRVKSLDERREKLVKRVVKRADELYRSGGFGMVEALFSSESFADLTSRAEMLSEISLDQSRVFVDLSRTEAELRALNESLSKERQALGENATRLADESRSLQSKFDSVAAEYERLKKAILASKPDPAPAPSRPAPRAPSAPIRVSATNGMTCPVAGPVSFVDSWGAPRDGHTHQGVDMMAAAGTPVVAIVSGAITLADYGDSAGYWQILSGNDGNQYWYMHNQQNIVTGGSVSAGQQIATVGDTGNAAGTPHLHFEYHPGGGSAVNPYPLVASVC